MRNMYLLSLGLLLALTENIMKVTTCDIGLSKIKGKCIDDNECESIQPPVCGEDAICFNTYGSFYCHCNGGFEPTHNFTQTDGIKCEDINECTDGSAVCGPNAVCANSAGGYLCTCKYGYISSNGEELFITEDGVQCIDRNECLDGSAVCGPNAECVNSAGGYSCTCKYGYISSNGEELFIAEDGVQCIDRNECDDPGICGINATCHNTPGSHYCICAVGFTLTSGETNFTDSDELCMSVCDIDKSICGEGTCTNSKDGHECVCKSGFTNYGHKQMKCTGSKISVLHILSSVLAACPYLLVTVVLIYKCCRMRVISVEEEETSI
ncbi:adhesion G protein-coupled receptor E2 isoform X2 [Pimephales promelas]|uniref:adhesion G protein-coupled receptor E2 isoform X2 n=1 Tax=Pimephales promelas TaxID=90988 RepID=UPI0019555B7F|nr:adhesion G protein-coupled receptor E2 isoform X2 [Pimephales promelas]